jgi:DNA-binding response OmpR family regulator
MLSGVGGVLLVSRDWRTRALLRAQLIEEGCPVMAFESVADAEEELQRSAFEPGLLIAEIAEPAGGEPAASEVAQVSAWTRRVPVWVLATHSLGTESALEGRGFEAVIFRPFGIKELVERVKQRLGAS